MFFLKKKRGFFCEKTNFSFKTGQVGNVNAECVSKDIVDENAFFLPEWIFFAKNRNVLNLGNY